MNNSEVLEKLRAYLKCRGRQVKGIYYACNNKKCDNCDLCYMQGTVGEHIEAIEVAIQALEKLKDNEPCCRCDSKQTNADRIRNMSDEELTSVLFDSCIESMNLEECPYSGEESNNNKIRENCKKCILKWLQSEAE